MIEFIFFLKLWVFVCAAMALCIVIEDIAERAFPEATKKLNKAFFKAMGWEWDE